MNNRKFLVSGLTLALMLISLVAASTARQNSNANMSGRNSNASGMAGRSMDTRFMMMAAQAGMAEVELGRLALQRASSDAVKQYAQHMIDDHTKANDELMQLASTKGITLPTAPDAKHQALMTKMQQLTGTNFDREYIKNAGVKDHTKVLKEFQKEASGGRDADAKAYAAKYVPAIQDHLHMAQGMAHAMMGTNTNSNTMK